jgi:hypothetical protein
MEWFVSFGDDRTDLGRVEMYCDNQECDSRETVLLITRGHDDEFCAQADTRPDVQALMRPAGQ